MKGWMLAATLGLALLPMGAKAADLDDGPPPPRYYGGAPYDDSRYADIYRYPERRPVPPAPVYRDDNYPPPPPRFERFSERGNCVPRQVVRERLLREGWQDFQEPDVRGEVVTLRARRPSGRPFVLTIDRCSGEVVNARPAYQPGPYAYGPPPRRYERPYY